jgi:hemoglobin
MGSAAAGSRILGDAMQVHSSDWGPFQTPHEAIGGDDGVRRLVEAFYDTIEAESPGIRAMLPRDTSTSRQKLYEFLSGWLGGPPLYVEKRGHPRLRMRHLPFPIGTPEAQEWMRCMRLAMDEAGVGEPLRAFLDERLEMSAMHVRNQPD